VSLWQDPEARLILISNFLLVVGSGITWIAVPWLLIHQPSGEALYGISNAVLTLLIFILLPYLGKVIDRTSRKKVIVGFFLFGIATNLFVATMILIEHHVAAWHLIVSICLGSLGASVYFPAQYAFNQEVLSRDQYKALSGAIEVQWQAAAMIAGGLAAFLINRVPLTIILLFDALTFAAGLFVISFVPYEKRPASGSNASSAWEMMLEGFNYLRHRPRLSLVMFSGFLPFLGVMLTGYLGADFREGGSTGRSGSLWIRRSLLLAWRCDSRLNHSFDQRKTGIGSDASCNRWRVHGSGCGQSVVPNDRRFTFIYDLSGMGQCGISSRPEHPCP